ncbi:unnamed protein product [Rhizopus stolonifer]
MSAAVKLKDKSPSTTQKILRKLHLSYNKNNDTDQKNKKTNEIVKVKFAIDPPKKLINNRLSILLTNGRQECYGQATLADETEDRLLSNETEKTHYSLEANPVVQNQKVSLDSDPNLNRQVHSEEIVLDQVTTSEINIVHESKEDENRSKLPLPSPPITPATRLDDLKTPPASDHSILEKGFEQPQVIPTQRLRAATSFTTPRTVSYNTCYNQCTKQRPISCVDLTEDDYLAFKRYVHDLSDTCNSLSRRMNHYRIHKRLSQDMYGADLFQNECMLHCQQRIQKHGVNFGFETNQIGVCQHVSFENDEPVVDNLTQDTKCEPIQHSLEKERVTVKALQKQKEACYRDIEFLSRNVEELTAKNAEMKRKLDLEKAAKEKLKHELSSITGKLDETSRHVRELKDQYNQLAIEKSTKDKEIKELKRNSKLASSESSKSNDRLLTSQLRHSQNQVRLLKSTIEQFLRMGLFQEESGNSSGSASSSTSIELALPELKARQKSRQSPLNNTKTLVKKALEDESGIPKASESVTKKLSEKKLNDKVPIEKNPVETSASDLDKQMRELSREKEILQAEYSKAPSTGNALLRKRREEVESRLDSIDSEMNRIKLRIRSKKIT